MVTVEGTTTDDEMMTEETTGEEMQGMTDMLTETTGDSGPGFTALVGVVAIVAAALLAARNRR